MLLDPSGLARQAAFQQVLAVPALAAIPAIEIQIIHCASVCTSFEPA